MCIWSSASSIWYGIFIGAVTLDRKSLYSYIMTNSQSPWYLSCNPSDVMACMASSYADIHQ